jgi:hypothetical protein
VVQGRLGEKIEEIGWEHLENAAAEAERARKKGQTLREWIRDVYSRVYPEEKAQRLARRIEPTLEKCDDVDLDTPPTAPNVLGYRLMLNQVGGGAALSAIFQDPSAN